MFGVKNENGYVVKKNMMGNKLQVDENGNVVCTYSNDARDAKTFKSKKYAQSLLDSVGSGEVVKIVVDNQ